LFKVKQHEKEKEKNRLLAQEAAKTQEKKEIIDKKDRKKQG